MKAPRYPFTIERTDDSAGEQLDDFIRDAKLIAAAADRPPAA